MNILALTHSSEIHILIYIALKQSRFFNFCSFLSEAQSLILFLNSFEFLSAIETFESESASILKIYSLKGSSWQS